MAYLNQVRLIGRLTKDPEIKTVSKHQLCSFRFVVNRPYKTEKGHGQESTFVDVDCWGKLAETGRYLAKGRLVFVAGRLRFQRWLDQSSGTYRSKLNVIAENIQFLDSPKQTQQIIPRISVKPQVVTSKNVLPETVRGATSSTNTTNSDLDEWAIRDLASDDYSIENWDRSSIDDPPF